MKTLVEPTGAKALKFRVGGRMSRNEDAMPGRTEKLIPLVRKVFGEKMFMLADSKTEQAPPLLEELQDRGPQESVKSGRPAKRRK